jgi:hypothetical protein
MIDGNDWVTDVENRVVQLELEEQEQHDDSADEDFVIVEEAAILKERHDNIITNREAARTNQHKQAQKMLEKSG